MDDPNGLGELNSQLDNLVDLPIPSANESLGSDATIVKKALDRAAGPIVVYGDNYRIVYANTSARKLWPEIIMGVERGLPYLEAMANQIKALMPSLSDTEIQQIATRTVAQHNSKKPNDVMGEGGRWFRIYHNKVKGEFVCTLGVEISQLKAREAELEDARRVAVKSGSATTEFLARMSHEIKTPLNAIVGMSDALREDVDDPDICETLDYIITAAEGLSHVLGQTLDHAKLISEKLVLELHEGDFADTVKNVAGIWKHKCVDKNIKLNINIHPNIPKQVVFDRFRYQQCLNNLLSNAIKFTDKGHITIAAKLIEKQGKSPIIALVVQDSGVGMDQEVRERVFLPYQQASKSTARLFGGTGLGLTITKQIIEGMGGTISVQSQEGKGAAFLLTMPANLVANDEPVEAFLGSNTETAQQQFPVPIKPYAVTKNPPEGANTNSGTTPFEGLSVLCVEDNLVNHSVIKKLIGKHVKSLIFAENGEEGLQKLATHPVDVVLMDIHMPVMDGIEATMKIRNSDQPWADVIIIAVTADPDFQYQRVCRNIGMNDAIGKPVKRKDILDSVARSLDVLQDTHAQRIELPVAI